MKKIPKRYQNQACHQPKPQQPQATLLGLKFRWNNINWTIVAIDPSKGIAKINSGNYNSQIELSVLPKVA